MSSLLEEAIVDAKALKDAALKNAENTVLEKYSGEVKSALSTLLEQDDFGLTEDEPAAADTSFTDDIPFAFQNEELDAPPQNELIEIDFDALKARIEEEEASHPEMSADTLTNAPDLAADLTAPTEPQLPLEEAEGSDYMTADADASARTSAIGADEEDGDDELAVTTEDQEIDLTEEMLADLLEELVVDMTPRPQGWSSEGSAYNSVIQANDEAMASAQEAHLEEEEETEAVHTAPDVVSDAELYESRISEITTSNRELRALLIEAREQLTQLNLANAKLVYQNKALSSASLNERQKNKIVEAVQLANSVEEAQVLFETIQNAVGVSSSINGLRPQTLREAVTRPTSLLINSKRDNTATKDPKLDRMLRLAGLNK